MHLLFNCPYCRKFLFKLPSIIAVLPIHVIQAVTFWSPSWEVTFERVTFSPSPKKGSKELPGYVFVFLQYFKKTRVYHVQTILSNHSPIFVCGTSKLDKCCFSMFFVNSDVGSDSSSDIDIDMIPPSIFLGGLVHNQMLCWNASKSSLFWSFQTAWMKEKFAESSGCQIKSLHGEHPNLEPWGEKGVHGSMAQKEDAPLFSTLEWFFQVGMSGKLRVVVGSQEFSNVKFPMAPHQTQGHLMDLRFAWIWEWDDYTPENERLEDPQNDGCEMVILLKKDGHFLVSIR